MRGLCLDQQRRVSREPPCAEARVPISPDRLWRVWQYCALLVVRTVVRTVLRTVVRTVLLDYSNDGRHRGLVALHCVALRCAFTWAAPNCGVLLPTAVLDWTRWHHRAHCGGLWSLQEELQLTSRLRKELAELRATGVGC